MEQASAHAVPQTARRAEIAARAARPRPKGVPLEDPRTLSRQAIRLHAAGVVETIRGRTDGLLGRREAERLADRHGALVAELVDAGFWLECDTCYVVLSGCLADAWTRHRDPPST